MKRTTRYRLIEYIRVKKVASADELARVLRITAADARHHLASLEDEMVLPEPTAPVRRPRKPRTVKMVESPAAKAIEDEAGPVVGDPDYMEFMESREG